MAISILSYLKARDQKTPGIDSIKIETYIPIPNDLDYKNGFLERYFVQKTNDKNSTIFEVDRAFKNQILSNPMFQIQIIKWRLIGNPQEIIDSNLKSINTVKEVMPKLVAYLPNLLQFAKIN